MASAAPGPARPAALRTALLLAGSLLLVAASHTASAAVRKGSAPPVSPPAGLLAAGGNLGEAVSPSTPEQISLAEYLRQRGAVFYGAWWCPHCFHQKNLFGTEAGQKLPYVECDKEQAGRQRCQAAGIRAFPTWDLNGERREGLQTLEELKAWSGFKPAAVSSGAASSGSATKP